MNGKYTHRRIAAWLALSGAVSVPALAAPPTSMEQNFATPPNAARPWVYGSVMDGNFTRQGITADLEAIRQAQAG